MPEVSQEEPLRIFTQEDEGLLGMLTHMYCKCVSNVQKDTATVDDLKSKIKRNLAGGFKFIGYQERVSGEGV